MLYHPIQPNSRKTHPLDCSFYVLLSWLLPGRLSAFIAALGVGVDMVDWSPPAGESIHSVDAVDIVASLYHIQLTSYLTEFPQSIALAIVW